MQSGQKIQSHGLLLIYKVMKEDLKYQFCTLNNISNWFMTKMTISFYSSCHFKKKCEYERIIQNKHSKIVEKIIMISKA